MMRGLTLLGLGAGLMYYLDPDRGRRRRALVRDQLDHRVREFDDLSRKAARDAQNRARGLAAESRAMFRHDEAPDRVIVDRIRSALGRVVSHPRAIEVTVSNGRATLRGPIFADEIGPVIAAVASTRGVTDVIDRLEPHDLATDHPALQGGESRRRAGSRKGMIRENWSPSTRLLAGASGGSLLLAGLARGGLAGLAAGALGAGLLGRSLSNVEARKLLGIYGGNRAFEFHASITIDAPVDEVFAFLTNYENYPHILPNVREVEHLNEGHWRWSLIGPGGVALRVEDVMTTFVPNQFVAWHSIGGSDLRYAGAARYVERPDGGTTVHSYMAYNPPGGALGHGLAWLTGFDPKHQLHQILRRTKTFLETGKAPHDAYDRTPPAHHRVRAGS